MQFCDDLMWSLATLPEDFDAENRRIADDKVNILLLCALSKGQISKMLHGRECGDWFVTRTRRIVWRPHERKFSEVSDLPMRARQQVQERRMFIDRATKLLKAGLGKTHGDIVDQSWGAQDTYLLADTCATPGGASQYTRAFPLSDRIDHTSLDLLQQLAEAEEKLSFLEQRKISFSFGQAFQVDSCGQDCLTCPDFPQQIGWRRFCKNTNCSCQSNFELYSGREHDPQLAELFADQEGILLEEALLRLQGILGINANEPFAPLPAEMCTGWSQVKQCITPSPPPSDSRTISFFSPNGNLCQQAIIFQRDGKKIILPQTWWSCDPRFVSELNIPSQEPYLLLNSDRLARYRDAEVYVTDSLVRAAIYSQNYNADTVWTSWIGGRMAAPGVNWSVLEGRKVTYVVRQHSGLSVDECHKVAATVLSKLKNVKLAECNVLVELGE